MKTRNIKSAISSRISLIENTVQRRKQIWHCVTPKSASTYLTRILKRLWKQDCCQGSAVPYFQDRAQEPDVMAVFKRMLFNKKAYYSGHIHLRYSSYLFNYFLKYQEEKRGGVIVQYRDIEDTIVSMKDHIERDVATKGHIRSPWLVTLDSFWPLLNEDDKFRLVANFYAYWHFDFLQSWKNYPRRFEVEYIDVTTETSAVVMEICQFFGIEKSREEVDLVISEIDSAPKDTRRLNVGVSGRGKSLMPDSVQSYINEISSLILHSN